MIKAVLIAIFVFLFIGILWLARPLVENNHNKYFESKLINRDEPQPLSMRVIQEETAEENLAFTEINSVD